MYTLIQPSMVSREFKTGIPACALPWPRGGGHGFVRLLILVMAVLLRLAGPALGQADRINVAGLLATGQATVTSSAIDIGQTLDVFDGNTGTLTRSESINPMTVTLSFAGPQQIGASRVWFLAGTNRWRLETADSVADLDAGSGSYQLLQDWVEGEEAAWSERTYTAPVTCRAARLTLQRLTGDDYVHLNEWELFQPVVPPQSGGQIDVEAMLGSGQAAVTFPSIDFGQIGNAFDGDTGTLARSESINPMTVTLSFAGPQQIGACRVWFIAGLNRWRLETADSISDLDGGSGTYRLAQDWAYGGDSDWSERTLTNPVTCRVVRLTLERLTGDDYVHLSEWELFSPATDPPVITQQPASQIVFPGAAATFHVTAGGSPPLRYQWREYLAGQFRDIQGATGSSYSIPAADLKSGASYEVKVTNSLGTITSSPAVLAVNAQARFPTAPPDASEGVVIALTPEGIAGGWRFTGEPQWRSSGASSGGLLPGRRTIEFQPVPGYSQPPPEVINVISGQPLLFLSRSYATASPVSETGELRILIKPEFLTLPGLPVGERAQWRFSGEDDFHWRESGEAVTGLVPGTYFVECKPVPGKTGPATVTAGVAAGEETLAVATYFPQDPAGGTPPEVVLSEDILAESGLPYAFTGQLVSDSGSGSGFAVGPNVIATAAHNVFDEGTLAAVTGLQWLFQKNAGSPGPVPIFPRGFYLLSGYAAQRELENTPGESSPASRSRDAAALIIPNEIGAGRNGYSGYLVSDGAGNGWLTSPGLKTLTGYPFAGIPASDAGKMHATPPATVAFISAGPLVYTTTDISAGRGCDGGPLCVQFTDGHYYPAGIFLGGSPGAVRVIDTELASLFHLAENYYAAGSGSISTEGGITQSSIQQLGAFDDPAALQVVLEPAAAVTGGRWRIGPAGTIRRSGDRQGSLTRGEHTIYFTPVAGFFNPGVVDSSSPTGYSLKVTLDGGSFTSLTAAYGGITTQPQPVTVSSFSPAILSVGVSGSPTFQWMRNGTPIPWATQRFYTIAGATSASAGDYSVTATWHNGSMTSQSVPLTVLPIPQAIQFEPLPARSLGQGPFALQASATSGLAVNFELVSGPASLEGNILALTGFGTVTVRASQAGSADYLPASPVEQSFPVTGDSLDTWRARHFTAETLNDPLISGPTADPDSDGISVLVEFALDLDPHDGGHPVVQNESEAPGLPRASLRFVEGQPRMVAVYLRRRTESAPGISYRYEFWSDPANPDDRTTGAETVTPVNAAWERVTVTDSQPAGARRFGHLVVTMP